MIKNNNVNLLLLGLILYSSLVSAAGIATPYWNENPLKMYPGETTTILLTLQNEEETQVTFEVTILSDGQGIATFEQMAYVVPGKTYDVKVPIYIDIPEDFVYGGRHQIELRFSPVTTSEGGTLQFRSAFTAGFPIDIVNEKESTLYQPPKKVSLQSLWYLAIIIILIIITIEIFIWKKRRKTPHKKTRLKHKKTKKKK